MSFNLFGLSIAPSFLLTPKVHSPSFTMARGRLINTRVQQIASLFSFLTLSWIAIEVIFLPSDVRGELIFGRVLTALAFFLLFQACRQAKHLEEIYVNLFLSCLSL